MRAVVNTAPQGHSGEIWEDSGRDEYKGCTAGAHSERDPVAASACVKKAGIAPAAADPLIQKQLRGARACLDLQNLSWPLCCFLYM